MQDNSQKRLTSSRKELRKHGKKGSTLGCHLSQKSTMANKFMLLTDSNSDNSSLDKSVFNKHHKSFWKHLLQKSQTCIAAHLIITIRNINKSTRI